MNFITLQIDMKNITQPIQTFHELVEIKAISSTKQRLISIELARNEFTGYNDSFGFLTADKEPFKFMSLQASHDLEGEIVVDQEDREESQDSQEEQGDSLVLPYLEI